MPWSVYILRCGDGSLYTGSTNDLERRLQIHGAGKGARYTRSRLPVALVYSEPARTRGSALSREAALKALPRADKLALVYTAGVSTPPERRVRHIVTRAHLATILAPTYAAALAVDEEEAHERLAQAVQNEGLQDEIYGGLVGALQEKVSARTGADALLDKLSAAIESHVGRVRAAASTPAISAVLVRVNLVLGIAPEAMRAMLESDKGRALVSAGLRDIGRHLLKELLK